MKKRLLLLINPVAGKSEFRPFLSDICEEFFKGGFIPELHYTAASGDAARIAAGHAGGFDLVACIGGDGTLSEVFSGLVTLEKPPPVGYIPMGTANDVAKTLGLPRDPVRAAQAIVCGRPSPLDIGVFGDNGFFTYIAAFGAFTEASYATPREAKQTFGHLAYIFEGMTSLTRLKHYRARVEHDGGVIDADFAFGGVTNTTSVAGLVKLDETLVGLNDGLFEIILIRNPRRLTDMNKILSSLLLRNYNNPYVTILHSREVRFSFDKPVSWTRDGESGGKHRELFLKNLHAAVQIIA